MARIRRWSNSDKEELGRIVFDDNTIILKETHRSLRGTYDVSIKDIFGNYLYTIQMDREQINRIKENKGISKIDFISEEGFRSFIEYTYLGGREFNDEEFKDKFIDNFYENFKFLKNSQYEDANEDGIVDYITYLTQFVTTSELEELYYQNSQVFGVVWKYNVEGYGQEQVDNARITVQKLEKVATEIQLYLNARGVNYLTKDEYMSSI